MEKRAKAYTVSRLAKMAGVSVRTLHHYDAIGLLAPSARTEAGYRVPHLVVGLSSEREVLGARLLEYACGQGCTTFGAGTFCKLLLRRRKTARWRYW